MKKAFQFLLVILGCLHLAGGPHSIIQVYAWATMLVDYSRDDGLLQATKDTFSGEKPCSLCCKIKEAKENESGEDSPLVPASPLSAKLLQEMLPAGVITVEPPPVSAASPVTFAVYRTNEGTSPASPPLPPPRA